MDLLSSKGRFPVSGRMRARICQRCVCEYMHIDCWNLRLLEKTERRKSLDWCQGAMRKHYIVEAELRQRRRQKKDERSANTPADGEGGDMPSPSRPDVRAGMTSVLAPNCAAEGMSEAREKDKPTRECACAPIHRPLTRERQDGGQYNGSSTQ